MQRSEGSGKSLTYLDLKGFFMARIITFGELMLRLQPYNYERFVQCDHVAFTFGGGERVGIYFNEKGASRVSFSNV